MSGPRCPQCGSYQMQPLPVVDRYECLKCGGIADFFPFFDDEDNRSEADDAGFH